MFACGRRHLLQTDEVRFAMPICMKHTATNLNIGTGVISMAAKKKKAGKKKK